MAERHKINPELRETIAYLRKVGQEHNADIWIRVADTLSNPTRHMPAVNLSRLDRYARDGETIVVPGKVLGSGMLDKDITVGAFQFSQRAREVINENGSALRLKEFVEKHKKGTDVRLMK